MRPNKGFVNRAKSGAKAMSARWRQAVEKARIERRKPIRRSPKGRS